MKNILIITGGAIDYEWAKEFLDNREYAYCIAADRGLVHADKLGVKVDFILGDYDSVEPCVLEKYNKNTEVVTYPAEKDYTDTHIALKKAIGKKPDSIDILGATGSRYDHAMTNVFIMKEALAAGIRCYIYDKHNKIYLIQGKKEIIKEQQYGKYLSFVPMTESVEITLRGVKYPLNKYFLTQGNSLCQSNEIVQDKAEIIAENGIIVAYETRD